MGRRFSRSFNAGEISKTITVGPNKTVGHFLETPGDLDQWRGIVALVKYDPKVLLYLPSVLLHYRKSCTRYPRLEPLK